METERKDFRMFSLEERERAVGLYFTTPMATAQVVEHLGYPTRQCLERWLAMDSRYAGHMAKPIIPLETRLKAIELVLGGIIFAGHLGITGPAKSPDSSMRSDGSSSNGSGAGNADNADGASGNNGTGTSGADAVADNPLELVESGWSVSQQGYVSYAFALRNTSTTLQVQYPEVAITGRAKDGSIVFSQTQTLNMAFPNQTIYDAGQAGQGTAPATVDFVVLSPNEYNVTEAQGTATFPISGISKVRNNDGGTTFNGEVRAVTDGFEPSDGQQIKVSLVLRDKQGAIIYGEMAFVDWPDNGQSMPFSIPVYDLPDYTSYESYAQIW